MAMGKRRRDANQGAMWVATHDLPRSAAHPFYAWLNQILDQHDFDGYVEGLRSYISEPGRGRRNWKKNPAARDAVYRNRRRIRGPRGLRLLRLGRPYDSFHDSNVSRSRDLPWRASA